MKQVKVLVLTLIVLMGIGFTSCMNSDDNYTPIYGKDRWRLFLLFTEALILK